mmetsp:Transcript_18611/g.23169  ORF Transcript_18611/g.23169 Transcript_18611/m.23169 type:complete len:211 (+) Transcript_18611:752-1384(+)
MWAGPIGKFDEDSPRHLHIEDIKSAIASFLNISDLVIEAFHRVATTLRLLCRHCLPVLEFRSFHCRLLYLLNSFIWFHFFSDCRRCFGLTITLLSSTCSFSLSLGFGSCSRCASLLCLFFGLFFFFLMLQEELAQVQIWVQFVREIVQQVEQLFHGAFLLELVAGGQEADQTALELLATLLASLLLLVELALFLLFAVSTLLHFALDKQI